MKVFLFALATAAAATAAAAPAQAQNYPWCAYYGSGTGGATNCGFVTYGSARPMSAASAAFASRTTPTIHRPGRISTASGLKRRTSGVR